MDRIELWNCDKAPTALGNYSHAVSYGSLVIVSGIASRDPKTNQIPGLKLDSAGKRLSFEIRAETRATLTHIANILETAGSGLDCVLEINTYLLDMKDFAAYNEVFAEFFPKHKPARTTIGVASLPGQISIEMKAIAVKR